MQKLLLVPDSVSYSVKDGNETVRSQLDGGTGRYRKDIAKSSSRVTVQWVCDRWKYEYLRAFYKGTASDAGATPFLIDLIMDEGFDLTEHTAYFIPDSMVLAEQSGHAFVVQAELEVRPNTYPEGYFDLMVYFYEQYGDKAPTEVPLLLNELEKLINFDLPALPAWVGG